MSSLPPVVLTVAGSDPSGGAGLQADLKTIHRLGGYGAAVPTLITVQNTRGVARVEPISADLVRAQLDNLLEDLRPAAAKTGALGSVESVHALGSIMAETGFPWVVDPVWLPSRGRPLGVGPIVEAYVDAVLPHAALVTPNLQEAAALVGTEVRTLADARSAAEGIAALGARAVLLKGGHLKGDSLGTDVLLHEGTLHELPTDERIVGRFHGTGCALSAAIATNLAHGDEIAAAVERAKEWLTAALRHAFAVGADAWPVNHLWRMDDKAH